MTQEEKELLLKYLCMALPYGVKVYCGEDWAMTLKQIDYKCFCECWENEDIKSHSRWKLPYLRPMSSMTEEDDEKWWAFSNEQTIVEEHVASIQYLLENHFDYMGLIPKGLAIEVTKENNPYEQNKS